MVPRYRGGYWQNQTLTRPSRLLSPWSWLTAMCAIFREIKLVKVVMLQTMEYMRSVLSSFAGLSALFGGHAKLVT